MNLTRIWPTIDLRLFDAGAGGAGAGDGAGAVGTGVTGQEDAAPVNPKAAKRNPLAGVQYGIQPQGTQTAGNQGGNQGTEAQGAEGEAPQGESFDELVKGRYKADFDTRVQSIVQDRLKNAKASDKALKGIAPMLQALAQKNGMNDFDPSNPDMLKALSDKVTNDDALYMEEAADKGIPVDVVKQMHELAQLKAEREQQAQQSMEEQQAQQHFQKLIAQAEQVKQVFPDFDLQKELQTNLKFLELTSPVAGIDVMTAYQVTHSGEIMPQAMQVAAQKVSQKLASSVQANARRPAEAGLAGAPAVDVRSDPSKWTRADRAEVRRRVMRGELIEL